MAIVTAEMLERQRKLWWWKGWVSLVVKTTFILLKFCLVMVAVALFPEDETDKDEDDKHKESSEDRKKRKHISVAAAIDEWDRHYVWTPYITDQIVDLIAHTGLKVCGYTIFSKQLPDTAEETRAVLGDDAAQECWSVQQEMTMSWWKRLWATGHVDVKGLREIAWVQRLEWALFNTAICHAASPYCDRLVGKMLADKADESFEILALPEQDQEL